jgi:hypothetical protein
MVKRIDGKLAPLNIQSPPSNASHQALSYTIECRATRLPPHVKYEGCETSGKPALVLLFTRAYIRFANVEHNRVKSMVDACSRRIRRHCVCVYRLLCIAE